MRIKTVCVDFDGTCVDHRYPDIGPDAPMAGPILRALVANGVRLILWTMRSGDELQAAVDWFRTRKIPLFGVNSNPEQVTWTTSPKAYAQAYIDDAAVGAPLMEVAGYKRPCLDWVEAQRHLVRGGFLKEEEVPS